MSYVGPVARMRAEMERERAALAIAGETPAAPLNCPIARQILRRSLYTTPWFAPLPRPWRLGIEMIGPAWLWRGVARVLLDHRSVEFVTVWTRKQHRAWRAEDHAIDRVAAEILQGSVTDPRW